MESELKLQWGCKKLVATGYKWKKGWLAYIAPAGKPGRAALMETRMTANGKPKVVATFPLKADLEKYAYYIDTDGDVSRCNRKYVTVIKRLGWISESK